MKLFNTFLIMLFSVVGLGYEVRPDGPLYMIVSDVMDSTVESGVCVVEGLVKYQYGGEPLSGATISNLSRTKKTETNSNGNYELKLGENDSGVFMFHRNYGEIVIPSYDFKSGHRVVINFYPTSRSSGGHQTVKKPVIYLYGEKATKVNIKVNHSGITFTYPVYKDSWNVQIQDNGNLLDVNSGKQYPYLFWEADTDNLTYQKSDGIVSGFLLKTDTLVSFMEQVLTLAGLNQKEQTDFITFWVPDLIHTSYVFIQFLIDEAYDTEVARLEVNPLPESRRRIFMLYTPLQNPQEIPFKIENQEISSFQRSGLTLIEWGGAMIDLATVEIN